MRLANSQFTQTRLLPSKHLSWLLMALCLLFIAGCGILPRQGRVPEPALPLPVQLMVVNREGNYPFPPCDVKVYITH